MDSAPRDKMAVMASQSVMFVHWATVAGFMKWRSTVSRLRALWLPGFPFVWDTIPRLQRLLGDRDAELLWHLESLGLDFSMALPQAWLTLFAKWLPLPAFLEVVPFLQKEGLLGVVSITLMLLLYHRWFLLSCNSFEEVLAYLASLPHKPPPDDLLDMCAVSLPGLRDSFPDLAGIRAALSEDCVPG